MTSDSIEHSPIIQNSNRRHSPRQDICIPSVLVNKQNMTYSTIMDFSEGGVRLRTSMPLHPDDEIELIIKQRGNPLADPIHLKLEVRHCRAEDEQSFSIGTQLKNYIDDFVNTLHSYTQPNKAASLSERLGFILA